MDKSAIKNYAVEARRKLIKAVRQKAYQLYIFEDGALSPDEASKHLRSDGIFLSPEQDKARLQFCNELAALGHTLDNKASYLHMVEEVAYTWFNRLIALRFMEVNEYLPTGIRILSSCEPGRIEPDAVREIERLDYVNQAKAAELRADTAINAAEKLYKYILISQCNALSTILPGMFQKANDYTELLLPDALLAKGGIVYDLINEIDEKNFKIRTPQDELAIVNGTLKEEDAPAGQIEIIGWLYQYYISELNEIVYDGTFSKNRIPKELLPAATTIYTPDWAIRYMVDNSLGKMFVKEYPQIKRLLKYYIDSEPVENTVKIEDVKFLDPCMGSGHILVYAFDVLYQAYLSQGYGEREIPDIILKNNIFGLDIDERACQLAYFALMMKARSCNRRFFRRDPAEIPQPQVYATTIDCGIATYRFNMGDFLLDKTLNTKHQETLDYLITTFQEIEEYGSIIKLENRDYKGLLDAWNNYASATTENFNLTLWFAAMEKVVPDLIAKSIVLTQKYDVVVTNPPYLGSGRFSPKLLEYVNANYPDAKSDLSMVMYKHALQDLSKRDGYVAFITTSSWMYLSSFEKLRKYVLENFDFDSLVDFGSELFDGKVGHNLIAAWVNRNSRTHGPMTAIRLVDYCYGRRDEKEPEFFNPANRHTAISDNFEKIPGCPVAYWVSNNLFDAFEAGNILGHIGRASEGIKTGNNDLFLKYWFEISAIKFSFGGSPDKHKWLPHHKGGEFRRWFGNMEYVVNWENDGFAIKQSSNSGLQGKDMYFKQITCWSKITSKGASFRAIDEYSLFDSGSPALYVNDKALYVLGLLNSTVITHILYVINPTLNTQVGDVKAIPVLFGNEIEVQPLVTQNIAISRADWDSFETSWVFQTHPLVDLHRYTATYHPDECKNTIHQAFGTWQIKTVRQFETLKKNETELNRIFIEIYGLQEELTSAVEDKDVTVRKADLGRDIRSFISYAVGCMFGRYSLDEPGLAFAGGTFDMAKYKTFMPEDDNIIPIGSADYFDDDIVVRFIEFVRVVYGDNTLGENLSFIADALYPNGNGSPQERIRRYFLNDFYKDHVKIYQKRPIYWLMDSGKKDGFKALFYLHRYDKYTVARARTDYLHPLQRKYEAEIKRFEMLSGSTDNAREKAAYRKEIDMLLGKIDECRVYDQVVSHIAHQQLELDLDDGVKVNYEKFQSVEVPKDNGKTETMDLLGRI